MRILNWLSTFAHLCLSRFPSFTKLSLQALDFCCLFSGGMFMPIRPTLASSPSSTMASITFDCEKMKLRERMLGEIEKMNFQDQTRITKNSCGEFAEQENMFCIWFSDTLYNKRRTIYIFHNLTRILTHYDFP